MCGIAGIVAYQPSALPVDASELLRIRDAMIARGPDGEGLWLSRDKRAGLAHRRLSIIDLSPAGAQPMSTADGRYHVSFNGEIYNYRALRKELEAEGRVFRSHSDTEVLLHMYASRGQAMLHSLRGMYAFAIYDELERSLFLARDPFGIKPLYYADDGRTFRFASQVKALLKGADIDTNPAPAGHVGFLLWGHVPDPYTLFKGIRALPAGTSMFVDRSGMHSPRPFFDVAKEFELAGERPRKLSWGEREEILREALRDSVRHHLIADVPVGMFLSSGLDSSVIAAFAIDEGVANLQTLTLGFDEFRGSLNDETVLAEIVATHYGTTHRNCWVSKSDFTENLVELLKAMDQPSIDGVNTYFVSRAAAESGMRVAMSGLGGDELFGGYPSFGDIPRMVGIFGFGRNLTSLGSGFRRVAAPVLKRLTSPKYAGLLEYGGTFGGSYLLRRGLFMPWELPSLMDPDLAREGWAELNTMSALTQSTAGIASDFQRVSALELSWYMRNQLLRDSDWAGMAHSLEIRLPLVDVELFRCVARLSADKPLAKSDMAALPVKALPTALLKRKKTGFSVPVRDWLEGKKSRVGNTRGLRGWALRVNPPLPRKRRYLALITDAFGGRGGIAKFNRDFLSALCTSVDTGEVIAIPRLILSAKEPLPARLRYVTKSINSKFKYVLAVVQILTELKPLDMIVCGHLNLLPIAFVAGALYNCKVMLIIHGIDAWRPSGSPIINFLAPRIDRLIAVSELTSQRFTGWTGLNPAKGLILPNCVDMNAFRPSSKSVTLLRKYSLHGKEIIMTVGRLVSEERYKGFDEVIELLPILLKTLPSLVYLIVGEGDDRARLEAKARGLGVHDSVIFTGFVSESDKCEYYNLADAYVMPSRGEGFGIVFWEAMACGVPVIGSIADGSQEALLNGKLGALVNPDDPEDILRAVLDGLQQPKRVPFGLEYFSTDNFERRVHGIFASH